MSPRARVTVIVAAVALLVAGGTVALAVVTANDKGGGPKTSQPRSGPPPLVLDLGVRDDPEARALRQAGSLYNKKKNRKAAARRIFARYDSPEARVGAAFSAWPDSSLASVEQLAREHPRDSFVLLHLGYARLWSGQGAKAGVALREAARAQPDTPAAQRADDALHTRFPPGPPFFVPAFAPPARLTRLSAPQVLVELARAARRPDVHAKLLYGVALQRLGRRVSARRQFDAAARLAPGDPEARVAAAVGRFDKSNPSAAFSRLGPLTRRFPHAATVRFHLGLLLLWLVKVEPKSLDEARRQLRLAQAVEPGSPLAGDAKRLIARLPAQRTR